jgi:hypothetical protein
MEELIPAERSLLERTQSLMDEADPLEVSRALGIPYHWTRHFKGRKYRSPSIHRVQRIYEYLSGKHLEIK